MHSVLGALKTSSTLLSLLSLHFCSPVMLRLLTAKPESTMHLLQLKHFSTMYLALLFPILSVFRCVYILWTVFPNANRKYHYAEMRQREEERIRERERERIVALFSFELLYHLSHNNTRCKTLFLLFVFLANVVVVVCGNGGGSNSDNRNGNVDFVVFQQFSLHWNFTLSFIVDLCIQFSHHLYYGTSLEKCAHTISETKSFLQVF